MEKGSSYQSLRNVLLTQHTKNIYNTTALFVEKGGSTGANVVVPHYYYSNISSFSISAAIGKEEYTYQMVEFFTFPMSYYGLFMS